MSNEKDLGVEVITAYEFRQVGQVFFPPAMLRERLIKLGLVRAVTSRSYATVDIPASPADRMMRSGNDGRGRQRRLGV